MFKDKIRTMVRSILPSKARKAAKGDKKKATRANRQAVKAGLRNYDDDLDDDAGLVADIKTADLEYNRRIKSIVGSRRDADKINHFVRWAENVTKEFPTVQEKYYQFVGLVGGAGHIIKDHAIGHFINPKYDFHRDELRIRRSSFRNESHRRPFPKKIFIEKMISAINRGLEKNLNKILRKRNVTTGRCKPGSPCYFQGVTSYTNIVWRLRDDGTRERVYGHVTLDPERVFVPTPGLLSYNVCYKLTRHRSENCPNIIQFEGVDSIQRVAKILYLWPKMFAISELMEMAAEVDESDV